MRKFISILCAAVLTAALIPVAMAEETHKNGDWIYNSKNEIVAFIGVGDKAIVPEKAVLSKDFKVTSRGISGEKDMIQVKTFIVSSDVIIRGKLNFGEYQGFENVQFYNDAKDMPNVNLSFANCKRLMTLTLPKNLDTIKYKMCQNCFELANVSIHEGVTVIGDKAFENCNNLKEISLPDSIEKIEAHAFYKCDGLTELKLPKNLKSVANDAFSGCENLKKIYVPTGVDYSCVPNEAVIDDIKFEAEPKHTADFYHYFWHTEWLNKKVFPNIKDEFLICDGQLVKYLGSGDAAVIPNEVKVIGESAFAYNSKLKNVVIPNGVKEIGVSAFAECSALEAVKLPKSVELVDDGAFSNCSKLSELTIEGNTVFGNIVFFECLGLRDENIHVTGKILYKTSKFENDPFEFTKTSYAVEPYYEHDSIYNHIPPSAKPTNQPAATRVPKETTEATEPTATPKATAKPTASPELKKLEVKGGEEIKISVDGKAVKFDAQPFIDGNNRTLVPVRAVSEMLDAKVDWDEQTQTVTITQDGKIITIVIGSDTMTVDGNNIKMDTQAVISEERTYIPIRFAAEALGLTVDWIE